MIPKPKPRPLPRPWPGPSPTPPFYATSKSNLATQKFDEATMLALRLCTNRKRLQALLKILEGDMIMDDRPATSHYHGGQSGSATIIAWVLLVVLLVVGALLCFTLSLGVATVCGG